MCVCMRLFAHACSCVGGGPTCVHACLCIFACPCMCVCVWVGGWAGGGGRACMHACVSARVRLRVFLCCSYCSLVFSVACMLASLLRDFLCPLRVVVFPGPFCGSLILSFFLCVPCQALGANSEASAALLSVPRGGAGGLFPVDCGTSTAPLKYAIVRVLRTASFPARNYHACPVAITSLEPGSSGASRLRGQGRFRLVLLLRSSSSKVYRRERSCGVKWMLLQR